MRSAEWRTVMLSLALAGVLLGSVRALCASPHYLINLSPSEPMGIYRVRRTPSSPYARGAIVVLPVPAALRRLVAERGYLAPGAPLIKGIGALPGDTVCIDDSAASVNGRVVGPVARWDSKGRGLPSLRGCQIVPAGWFWPLSTRIANSFDGRYIGVQPLSAIVGEARAVWTF